MAVKYRAIQKSDQCSSPHPLSGRTTVKVNVIQKSKISQMTISFRLGLCAKSEEKQYEYSGIHFASFFFFVTLTKTCRQPINLFKTKHNVELKSFSRQNWASCRQYCYIPTNYCLLLKTSSFPNEELFFNT